MKIIDGLKLRGNPAEIPDCSRDDLPQFFVEMGYKVGAEIGVDSGEFSQKICRVGLKLFAVDPWKNFDDYQYSGGQKKFDSIYEHTKQTMSAFPNCTIVRKSSIEAVTDFEDESLDFVYIDGNHSFRYVSEDISEWAKKVKKEGTVSGHDYTYFRPRTPLGICHVIPVVHAYTHAFNIENWYVLGQKNAPPGEKRDKWRSWMFVKP